LVTIDGVVYIVARQENQVRMFDPERNVVLEAGIEVGMRPVGMATNGEKIYVANSVDNTVSVLVFP
jgi:DNA-binding beta-propeller fold protein YncE